MRSLRRPRGERALAAAGVMLFVLLAPVRLAAHDGPPFPIVSNRASGPYVVSVWTDPDTTDDGTAGGQFWVMLQAQGGEPPPAATRAIVAIRPLDREGARREAPSEPIDENPGRQFAAVVMDHEGRFAVEVTVEGPLGEAAVSAEVDATYDTRPPPIMLLLYLFPFVLVGLLSLRLLRRRREVAPPAGG